MMVGLADLFLSAWLPVALLIGAGGLWQRLHPSVSPVLLRSHLNILALNLFLPALVFASTAAARIDAALLSVPLLSGLASLLTGLVLYLALYRTPLGARMANRTRAALVLCGMFGNVLLIGYPVLAFLYGPAGGRYAVFTDLLSFTPVVWTLGVWIATRLGVAEDDAPVHAVSRILLRLPPVWAFAAGVACNLAGLPVAPLVEAARMIGQAAIPLLLFVLGLAIPWSRLRPDRGVLAVVAVKLVAMPAVAWLLALGLATDGLTEQHRAGILEAAMPCMTTAILLADRFHLDAEAVALMVGWSTLLLGLLLPAWVWLLH
jgi:hypothetical protein